MGLRAETYRAGQRNTDGDTTEVAVSFWVTDCLDVIPASSCHQAPGQIPSLLFHSIRMPLFPARLG